MYLLYYADMCTVSGSVDYADCGHTVSVEILENMGSGVSGMFETCMVAILVAAMCAYP